MRKYTKKTFFFLLLLCALLLAACGVRDEDGEVYELPPEPEDGVLVYAALNSPGGQDAESCGRLQCVPHRRADRNPGLFG